MSDVLSFLARTSYFLMRWQWCK